MLIVIEGLDRTGKTTLAASLLERLGPERTVVYHASKPTEHPLIEYVRPLMQYRPNSGEHIILDRWHIGEMVWPAYFGRKTELDVPMFKWIEAFMQSRGAYVIYADRSDYGEWVEELIAHDEPLKTEDDIWRAIDLFEEAQRHTTCHGQSYNWKTYDLEQCVSQIIASAHGVEQQAAHALQHTYQYVGSPTPDILLVGERFGKEDPELSLPFGPFKNTSGHFMLTELQDKYTGYYGWVNAYKDGGEKPEDLLNIWLDLGGPDIILLGEKASHAASFTKIPARFMTRAPHPQYWRRFKRKEGEGSYLAQLLYAGLEG